MYICILCKVCMQLRLCYLSPLTYSLLANAGASWTRTRWICNPEHYWLLKPLSWRCRGIACKIEIKRDFILSTCIYIYICFSFFLSFILSFFLSLSLSLPFPLFFSLSLFFSLFFSLYQPQALTHTRHLFILSERPCNGVVGGHGGENVLWVIEWFACSSARHSIWSKGDTLLLHVLQIRVYINRVRTLKYLILIAWLDTWL